MTTEKVTDQDLALGSKEVSENPSNEIRSLLQQNYKELLPRNSARQQLDQQEAWAKGSLGMISGSMAGFTSDGRNLTDGLNYSSSALDLASHVNMQQSATKSAMTQEEPGALPRF